MVNTQKENKSIIRYKCNLNLVEEEIKAAAKVRGEKQNIWKGGKMKDTDN